MFQSGKVTILVEERGRRGEHEWGGERGRGEQRGRSGECGWGGERGRGRVRKAAARFLALAGLLAAAVLAQRDPFQGMFLSDKVILELKGSGGKYSGTVTVQGQAFPASVTGAGTSANGTFAFGGRTYPFTLTVYGNGLKLTSEGVEYLLMRREEAPQPPAPFGPTQVAPKPLAQEGPPTKDANPSVPPKTSGSIVGSWRNATGYAQFNADGTGVVDGEQGRYEIRGDQKTLIGARGQITLRFAVEGDRVTLIGSGQIVLERVREEAGPGNVRMELVGKWCWISVVNAQQGARQIEPVCHAERERLVQLCGDDRQLQSVRRCDFTTERFGDVDRDGDDIDGALGERTGDGVPPGEAESPEEQGSHDRAKRGRVRDVLQ